MKKSIILIAILTLLFIIISCGTPVSEYEPKNQAEQELKALLIKFLDYRNKHDVDGLLSLIHSDAEVMQGHGENRYYATKKQSRETWPEMLESFPTVKFTAPPGFEAKGPASTVGVFTEKLPPRVFGYDGTANDPPHLMPSDSL